MGVQQNASLSSVLLEITTHGRDQASVTSEVEKYLIAQAGVLTVKVFLPSGG